MTDHPQRRPRPLRLECICICGARFLRPPCHFKSGKVLYCSYRCSGVGRRQAASRDVITKNSLPDKQGCWTWLKGKTSEGYGVVTINQVSWLAHRLSYTLFKTPLDSGATVVRHRCDNPSCVNPDHLEEGSVADNSRDAVVRNRICHGSNCHSAKLTESDIPRIREMLADHISLCEIGRVFGVDSKVISLIRDGKGWVRA